MINLLALSVAKKPAPELVSEYCKSGAKEAFEIWCKALQNTLKSCLLPITTPMFLNQVQATTKSH